MNILLKPKLKFLETASGLLTSLSLLYIILVHINTFAGAAVLGGDALSWVVQATATIHGFGKPFLDYWDIKPPGLIFLTELWIRSFGYGMSSLKLFFAIQSLGIGILIFLINKKLFSWWLADPLSILVAVLLFSSNLQTQFLASESYALLFSLVGLFILVRKTPSNFAIAIASFFFVFAGQLKDPYLLTIFSLFPVLFFIFATEKIRSFLTSLFATAIGAFLAFSITYLYLFFNSAIGTYRLVMDYKSSNFNILESDVYLSRILPFLQRMHETFIWQQRPIMLLFLVSFFLILISLLKSKKLVVEKFKNNYSNIQFSLNFTHVHFKYLLAIFYSIGSLVGFAMQGKLGHHYYIQIVYPFWLLIISFLLFTHRSLMKTISKKYSNNFTSILLFLFLLIPIAPKPTYFKEFLTVIDPIVVIKNLSRDTTDQDIARQVLISEETLPNDCIFAIYGWHLAGDYLYSHRKPCSPFFIINVITNEQKSFLVQDLLKNKPAAISYIRGYEDAFDVLDFEKNYFNFPKVLEKCYDKNNIYSDLYFQRKDINVSECIVENYSYDTSK